MRAVAYCRVSTNDLDQKNSLDNQKKHYKELFLNRSYTPVKIGMLYSKDKGEQIQEDSIFADEGITGTKKKNRKAFDYMMKCAANREFDIIFCKNIARFARNVGDGANDLKTLKGYGIKVVFEDGNLNYDEHEAIINMFLSMAQEESRAKSVAIKFGIRKGQKEGKWTSNCPYGYKRNNGYLELNETEAEVIKQIFNYYVNHGWGHNKILRYLNDNEVPTKKGGMWWQQHIKQILTNPIYKGVQTTHKSENKDVNINLIKDIPQHDWIINEIESLRIISDDLWEQAQDIDTKRTAEYKNKHRHSDKNLLSTVCKCCNCGGIMRRKKKKTKVNQKSVYVGYEWVCQNNDMYGAKGCEYRNAVPEDELIQFCKDRIEGYREHKEALENSLKDYISVYFSFDTESRLNAVKQKIDETKKIYANNLRLNGLGKISDEELEEFNGTIKKELTDYENEFHKLTNIDNELVEVKRRYKNYINYLDNIDIGNLTNADLKKIFTAISIGTYSLEGTPLLEKNTRDEAILKIKETGQLCYYDVRRDEYKLVWAEHMFMDVDEGKMFEDMYEKDYLALKKLENEGGTIAQ
jgi:site-specific DNA recombinase